MSRAVADERPGVGAAGRRSFRIWALVLTAACLWPIWTNRLLPMQDYPQHLFIAELLRTFGDPSFDWARHYVVDPGWGSYSLVYASLGVLGGAVGIEIAGKILVSLYVALLAALVARASREHPGHVPWPLLLIFPLAFNQTYFYGFLSYLLSIPILFLALLAYETWERAERGRGALLAVSILLGLLFLAHPYSVLVFLAWSGVIVSCRLREGARWRRAFAPALVLAAVFAAWYLLDAQRGGGEVHPSSVRWMSASQVLTFFALPFTGMRLTRGVDLLALGAWAAVAVLLVVGATRRAPSRTNRLRLGLFLVSAAGYLALPFWFSHYSYFNLRLAPIVCLLGVLLLGSIRMDAARGHACAALALLLVLDANETQARVSQESGEILPLLARMERNAPVLPVFGDVGTAVLDPVFFYQLHGHEHFYYHVLVGGGVNPELFASPLLPLRFRPGARPPKPDPARGPSWRRVIRAYRYVLVRGDERSRARVARLATFRGSSGHWALYENEAFDAS